MCTFVPLAPGPVAQYRAAFRFPNPRIDPQFEYAQISLGMKRKFSDENLQASLANKQKFEENASALYQIWSNTGMLLFLLAFFTVLGGMLFVFLEAPNEQRVVLNILKERTHFLRSLEQLFANATDELRDETDSVTSGKSTKKSQRTNNSPLFSSSVSRRAASLLHQYEESLQLALSSGYVLSVSKEDEEHPSKKRGGKKHQEELGDIYRTQWDLWGAMYYCFTVYTTIGYGNMFPRTVAGQFASVIYGMLGIPLCLLVLARLGQVFNRGVKATWLRFHTLFHGSREPVPRSISLWTLYNEVNEQFDYPLPLAIVLVCVYVWLGALIYAHWEKWTVTKAAYFTFVSLSTIGFGDVLPDDHRFFLVTSLYLFFGLALLSMLINALVERLEGYLDYYKKAR